MRPVYLPSRPADNWKRRFPRGLWFGQVSLRGVVHGGLKPWHGHLARASWAADDIFSANDCQIVSSILSARMRMDDDPQGNGYAAGVPMRLA